MRATISLMTMAAVVIFQGAAPAGGPLTPPPGAPAPTPGPEPRTPVNDLPGSAVAMHVIRVPGSYYLSGNIEATTPGLHGVFIDTPGPVSIDGMGFAMIGAPGSLDAFHIFDATGVPLRAQVSKVQVRGWDHVVKKSVGAGDTNPPDEDHLLIEDLMAQVDGGVEAVVHWTGDITLKRGVIAGGGIFNDSGTLTISDSTISGNSASHAIDADGLFMTNVEVRGGAGVRARKPREIVVVGSKVKEVVRGVAFDLAEGAVVTDSQADGTVDGRDFLIWQRNLSTADFSDAFFTPHSFGAGSRIEESEFRFIGIATGQTGATASEEVAFYYNKISFDGEGAPSSLARFDGGGSEIAGNLVQGVPSGAAGFEINDQLNLVHNNTFVGAANNTIGVVGTAGRSIFRNNTMLNIGTPFDLFGVGANHIGPVLGPTAATVNEHPDRNLEIPPVAPVR